MPQVLSDAPTAQGIPVQVGNSNGSDRRWKQVKGSKCVATTSVKLSFVLALGDPTQKPQKKAILRIWIGRNGRGG